MVELCDAVPVWVCYLNVLRGYVVTLSLANMCTLYAVFFLMCCYNVCMLCY
jgi:hypothetical protein